MKTERAIRRVLAPAAVIFALALAPMSAKAADEGGSFAVKGPGLGTCARYVQERQEKSQTYYLFVGWLTGYLSGYNRFAEDTLDIAPWQSADLLAAFMDNYCKKDQNADQVFAVAANQLIVALVPNRLRTKSEKVVLGGGDEGSRLVVYEAVLLRAQQALAERGLFKGAIDGKFGEEMESALRAFQQEKDLETSGLPDQRTLFALFK